MLLCPPPRPITRIVLPTPAALTGLAVAVRRFHYAPAPEPHAALAQLAPADLPPALRRAPEHPDTGVRLLTLTRPRAKNAISRQMLNELATSLARVENDPSVRVLVLSGHGNVFCAGADLKERAGMTPEETQAFLRDLRAVISGIARLPVPVVAALDGAALGGGLEVALAADVRVGSSLAAPLGLPEVARGIIPGAGGTARLPRTTSVGTALLLILTARTMDAEQAYERGILDALASPSGIQTSDRPAYDLALQLASEIASNAPLAVRAAKKSILYGRERNLDEALAWEAECYEPLLTTQDRLEGLRAFGEKRLPRYQGK